MKASEINLIEAHLKEGHTIRLWQEKECLYWDVRQKDPKQTKRYGLIAFGGKSQNLNAWAEEIGISPRSLARRIGRMPLDQALTRPKKEWPETIVTFRDKTQTLTAWAEELQIPRSLLVSRHSRGKPLDHESKHGKIEFKGKMQSLKKWAEELGVTYNTARQHLEKYHSFDHVHRTKYSHITFNGKTQSLTQWAEELNTAYHTLADRIRKNRPLDGK